VLETEKTKATRGSRLRDLKISAGTAVGHHRSELENTLDRTNVTLPSQGRNLRVERDCFVEQSSSPAARGMPSPSTSLKLHFPFFCAAASASATRAPRRILAIMLLPS
jgi:hypothetical protein